MSKIVLTRKQLIQLTQVAEQFEEIDLFTIKSENSSGIGPTVTVQFDLFNKADTKIDITDVESW
ncbi:hypothetical protein UFOVP71_264 [uncultured Caudovirales phage]|uniref:Uncharacterized protein n=1 Tax=uncultured Caudovirales phage TaxID=2100421 RepID=A0A6J5T9Z0_9CAUD|nr:hypothetical protein UFOVP71_264 [uncultured Caudovirales phage]